MPDSTPEFLTLFLATEADLRAFVGSLIRDPEVREDVFQEIAITLWDHFDKFDPKRAAFGAWARGVAANKILQTRRKNGKLPVAFPPETIEKIAEAYDADESFSSGARAEALRDCLRRLPDKSRRIVELRYEECLSGKQLAKRLGGTIDAIYQTLSRIRRGLETCIRQRMNTQNS